MKTITLVAFLLLLSIAGKAAEKRGPKNGLKPQLGTSFRFDGTTLRGKYRTSLGTSAIVENDKYLEDLLGGRRSFKDRIQEDQKRN